MLAACTLPTPKKCKHYFFRPKTSDQFAFISLGGGSGDVEHDTMANKKSSEFLSVENIYVFVFLHCSRFAVNSEHRRADVSRFESLLIRLFTNRWPGVVSNKLCVCDVHARSRTQWICHLIIATTAHQRTENKSRRHNCLIADHHRRFKNFVYTHTHTQHTPSENKAHREKSQMKRLAVRVVYWNLSVLCNRCDPPIVSPPTISCLHCHHMSTQHVSCAVSVMGFNIHSLLCDCSRENSIHEEKVPSTRHPPVNEKWKTKTKRGSVASQVKWNPIDHHCRRRHSHSPKNEKW